MSAFVFIFFTVLGSLSPTHASSFDCASLLDSLDARAAKMTYAERWLRGPLGRQIAKVRRGRLWLTTTALRWVPASDEQKKAACARVIAVTEREKLLYGHSKEVLRLFKRFCSNDAGAIDKLTEMALNTTVEEGTNTYHSLTYPGHDMPSWDVARDNVRRWMKLVIANGWLSAEQWAERIGGDAYRALPVLDATNNDLGRVGLSRAQILALAGSFAKSAVPFRSVATFSNLPREEWVQLEPYLNPIQWLSYRRAMGTLDDSILADFEARTKSFDSGESHHSDSTARRELFDLLYDTSVPYELFLKIHDRATAHWESMFKSRYYRPTFDRKGLDESRLQRAERFFGRAEVRRDEVWAESRKFAAEKTAHLRRQTFATADDFIDAFKMANLFVIPKEAHRDEPSVAWYETMAIAEQYFKILRKRLPDFFALEPTAAHARWILETPLQFPHGLHDMMIHWGKGRLSPSRYIPWQKGHYDIRRHIFTVMHETVEKMAASKKVRTIEDLFEITTFKVKPASEYEQIKRWAMNYLLDDAVRVGDSKLQWLDYLRLENDHELRFLGVANRLSWFRQLEALRNSIPAEELSEASINARAVEWLIGTELQERSYEVYATHFGSEFLRAITAMVTETPDDGQPREPDPELVRGGLTHLQEGLLRFLSIRTENGSPVSVLKNNFDALKQVALDLDYDLHVVRHTANGAVDVKVRRIKK